MKNVKTTFYQNDVLKRNFIIKYGRELRIVKIDTRQGACKILKLLLPQIPNVEQLTLNFSDIDIQNIQLRRRSINLPNLKKVEVSKPADLKIVTHFAQSSIKNVKYSIERCDLRELAEYLANVNEFECDYPVAAPVCNTTLSALSLDSLITVKFGTVHCGSIRDLKLPNIKSIEINKLARTDFYLRGFFNSINNVENMKINGLMNGKDITDVIGEVVRLPFLKTFSLKHAGIFSIFIDVKEHRIDVSDHIHVNFKDVMLLLRTRFHWYEN